MFERNFWCFEVEKILYSVGRVYDLDLMRIML